MATSTANPAGSATAKTTTERYDKAFGYQTTPAVKDDAGNVVTPAVRNVVMLETEEAEKLEKQGLFEGQVVTISCDYPLTFQGLIDFVASPQLDDEGNPRDISDVQDEATKLFRSGAKVKVSNRVRAILTKQDKDGNLTFDDSSLSDGVLDVTKEILSGSKRVFLSEEEKTWRNLATLPDATRKQMYDIYLTSIGKQTGVYPASE